MMYAVLEAGSKQYKVAQNDQILIEQVVPENTTDLTIDKVLLIVKDKDIQIGDPYLKNARVNCEVIAHKKGEKTIAFKFRRRKSSQTKRGHRQKLLLVKIKEIVTG